jgi:hypothetical protein
MPNQGGHFAIIDWTVYSTFAKREIGFFIAPCKSSPFLANLARTSYKTRLRLFETLCASGWCDASEGFEASRKVERQD